MSLSDGPEKHSCRRPPGNRLLELWLTIHWHWGPNKGARNRGRPFLRDLGDIDGFLANLLDQPAVSLEHYWTLAEKCDSWEQLEEDYIHHCSKFREWAAEAAMSLVHPDGGHVFFEPYLTLILINCPDKKWKMILVIFGSFSMIFDIFDHCILKLAFKT